MSANSDITQENRPLKVSTILPENTLLLYEFKGSEHISEVFEFECKFLAQTASLDAKSLLGTSCTVSIQRVDGSFRYFNGIIARFTIGNKHQNTNGFLCNAKIVPQLWTLHLTQDCRIFQEQSVQEIVSTILKEHGVESFEFKGVTGGQESLVYCVQYRESAFNFISRLLEREGIFYFFEHSESVHKLVFADSPSEHPVIEGNSTIPLQGSGFAHLNHDTISFFESSQQLKTTRVSLLDYDFESPSADLSSQKGSSDNYVAFDYPGGYTNTSYGSLLANAWHEANESEQMWLDGNSTARGFSAGYSFTSDGMPDPALNTDFVILTVHHISTLALPTPQKSTSSGGLHYGNRFRAFSKSVPFHPPRHTQKPTIQGTQTAVVVGSEGEEIETDIYGRVLVQFHWDRVGTHDEKSSCWIRVAQASAGNKWGSLFIPRVGQEVVVSFLEGDPDCPLIIGGVYNAAQKPPLDLPTDKTRSTIKTESSKGGGGFNEIRFEDKKDDEEIFIHAQKNFVTVIEDSMTEQINKIWSKNVDEEILIVCGESSIHMTKDGLIEIVGKNIIIKSSDTIDMVADGTTVIEGALVKINC